MRFHRLFLLQVWFGVFCCYAAYSNLVVAGSFFHYFVFSCMFSSYREKAIKPL